ncbi:MAG: peptide-methionine (S)-S-oxide reductase MsrA [Bryobacteraceae bacterium]|nr:peptide-methionine (S)-S-oxide reductase MsrA [Bryobacteraceae bacterium]
MTMKRILSILLTAALLGAADFPDPAVDVKPGGRQTAVFAGGCFWCTEVVFENVAGVEKVISGYAGGSPKDANYKLVSEGATEHAEAIEITYDSSRITYGQLLKIFFSVAHDPTQLNRQGPDWGKQYRSAIFYATANQKSAAEAYIRQLTEAKLFSKPVVTEIAALNGFYAAEGYHQDFVRNNPNHPYVVVNALPKVEKLKKTYPALVRK